MGCHRVILLQLLLVFSHILASSFGVQSARVLDRKLSAADPAPAIVAVAPPGAASGDLPLPYSPQSVTAACVTLDTSLADKDNVVVDIAGAGPLAWSLSRWNSGDFALRIQPRHPFAQKNLGVPPGPKGFTTQDPKDFSAQAWRPHRDRGITLATVAQNGQLGSDGQTWLYGTISASTDSSGYGYSMIDGTFGQEDPSLDICVGAAGAVEEASADFGVAWFPYAQGWTAGFVAAPSSTSSAASWQGVGSHSADLPDRADRVVQWADQGAQIRLPGVNPGEDGMLFAISTDPGQQNSATNIIGVKAEPGYWTISPREDDEDDATKLAAVTEWMFAFLYVPYSTSRLVAGYVNGATGSLFRSVGGLAVARVTAGQYEVSFSTGTKTARDGTFLLQVAGADPVNRAYARAGFLSYNFTNAGTALVEARRTEGSKGTVQTFPLVDTDFYILWVDFNEPPLLSQRENDPEDHESDGGSFGVGFLLGGLVLGVLSAVAYIMYKYLKSRREDYHSVMALPLGDMAGDDDELENDLLHNVDYSIHE